MFGFNFPLGSDFINNKNRDDKLYFDKNLWGFVYIRDESRSDYLINNPTKFPRDAKTSRIQKWVTKTYFKKYCDRVYDLKKCKYAYKPTNDEYDLGYRAVDQEDYQSQFICNPKSILNIFKN